MNTPITSPKPIRVSVSQMKLYERCQRAYWYSYGPMKRKSPPSPAAAFGSAVHDVLEHYLKDGTPLPDTRAGRVASVGLKHLKPSEELEIERNITLSIGDQGATILCRIDMLGEGYIGDHKTTGDFKWAKSVHEVAHDVQLLTYAYAAFYEAPPEEVEIELVYYRTRGLPIAMKVGATVPWDRVVQSWETFSSKVPALQVLRDNQTGEGVQGNSSACGDYGGCFHCEICPFSPEGLKKNTKISPKKVRKPLNTDNNTLEQQLLPETPEKEKDMSTISRLLPSRKAKTTPKAVQAAPKAVQAAPKAVQAAPQGAAKKIASVGNRINKYLTEFEETIEVSFAKMYLEKGGVDLEFLGLVLKYAGAVINVGEGTISLARVSPKQEALPEEPEALPEEPEALYQTCGIETLKAEAFALGKRFPEGVAEQDAMDWVADRIPGRLTVRRWGTVVEHSNLTLDGGWLHIRNPQGYTEDPEALTEAPEPVEVSKPTQTLKAPTEAPEPSHWPDVPYDVPELLERAVERVNQDQTVDALQTELSGWIKLVNRLRVSQKAAEDKLTKAEAKLTKAEEARYDHSVKSQEAEDKLAEAEAKLAKGFREVHGEAKHTALTSSLVVMVDCICESTPQGVFSLSEYLSPYQEMVEKQNSVPYWDLVEYAKGQKMVLAQLLADLHKLAPIGVLYINSREPLAEGVLALLRKVEGVVIIRALR